ncbi:alpha/beta fold hydrolase [Fulvivirga sp. M361]|uniref:type I polyketide synthase n=1 Tax=Fulvivirga sp. M361 TaxID=2594266 RepID=UPI001179C1CE|nr:type I polyketide synthase [Fulvivirga sp. M361]TRX48200.1 alpha/beta fold hydrolase [Fulvivirga sp. M361]
MKKYNPIAVVGMSGRFPGADNLSNFWDLLSGGKESLSEIDSSRWKHDKYYHPDRSVPGKTNQKHAAFLKDINKFDPLFFNISPAEAIEMNPSQKLMMELTWSAIENAKMATSNINGALAGVYVGNIWSDFEHQRKHNNAAITSHSAIGQSSNAIANRISYYFGFRGPSLVLDTGCSSSLVALHMACQGLQDGTIDIGLAGAVNHLLDPDQYVLLSKFGGLSSKGKCSTFDAEADGFVRGEGGAMFLLKRLQEAEKDGDHIYAVIKGSAVNNNGFNINLPATSVSGQKEVLTQAYECSGIQPHEVHYVEAHGTGTKLGDPTECLALGEFFGDKRDNKQKLRIGSVKTNIGHLEGAAGMAGLAKVILSMNNKALPKNLNFKTPNPSIDFEGLKLEVQTEHTLWPVSNGETFKAGINSFGWGGTNAHVVIEEYQKKESEIHQGDKKHQPVQYFLPLSARSESALKEYVKNYIHYLTEQHESNSLTLEETCVATSIIKPAFEYKKLFQATSKDELISGMEEFLSSNESVAPADAIKTGKIVFIFPGQGSQWTAMGKALYEKEETFRRTLDLCDKVFSQYTSWSLIDKLYGNRDELREIDIVQPILCAVQIALAEVWKSWGITPDTVVGHSMGEIAAAYISGSLSLHDAANVICTRSKLMKTVSGNGAMAVTELTVEEAQKVVERYPTLSVAVNNSPKSTVLAGDEPSIKKMLAEMEEKDVFARQVKVNVASHSSHMDPLKGDLHQALNSLWPLDSHTDIYSTVLSQKVNGKLLNADYWVSNLRNGVRFASVMEQLVKEDHKVFIEVSPHPVLTTSINECLDASKAKSAVVCHSLHKERSELTEILSNFNLLFDQGVNIDWSRYYRTKKAPDLELPGYPFQKESYEIKPGPAGESSNLATHNHPWLGEKMVLGGMRQTHYWEKQINLEQFTILMEKNVGGRTVMPPSFYIEVMLAALNDLQPDKNHALRKLSFKRMVLINEVKNVRFQVKIVEDGPKKGKLECYYSNLTEAYKNDWILILRGEYCCIEVQEHHKADFPIIDGLEWNEIVKKEEFYNSLEQRGIKYSPGLQGVHELKLNGNQILANLALDHETTNTTQALSIPPSLLESCIQAIYTKILTDDRLHSESVTTITSLGTLLLLEDIDLSKNFRIYANSSFRMLENQREGIIGADLVLFDHEGRPVLLIQQLNGKISFPVSDVAKDKLYYKTKWIENNGVRATPPATAAKTDTWLLFEHSDEKAQEIHYQLALKDITIITVQNGTSFLEKKEGLYEIDFNSPDQYVSLIQSVLVKTGGHLKGIIYALDRFDQNNRELDTFSNQHYQNLTSIVSAVEKQMEDKTGLDICIVTENAQSLENDINLAVAPLLGYVRVLANEQADCNIRVIDTLKDVNDTENLINEMLFGDRNEREIGIRNGKHYYARLDHYRPNVIQLQKNEFSAKGYYLVTELNRTSLHYIKWMFSQGARKFLLVENDQSSGRFIEKVEELTQAGAELSIKNIDTTDYLTLLSVIRNIESDSPLLGIVHHIKPMGTHMSSPVYTRAIIEKIKSSWNLHKLSLEIPVEKFILLSSASAMIGPGEHGNSAACYAFMDQLGALRKAKGLPVISINWGGFSYISVPKPKNDKATSTKWKDLLVQNKTVLLGAYGMISNLERYQLGIFDMDVERIVQTYPYLSRSNYFEEVRSNQNLQEDQEVDLTNLIKLLPTLDEKKEQLQKHLVRSVASIIKADANKIGLNMTFKGLGVDSIMAVQLRNQLEKALSLKLSISDFWENPTISAYAEFALEKLIDDFKIAATNRKKASPFIIPKPNANAQKRLFCFHDAGGNSTLFNTWEDHISPETELVLFELPGRGHRSSIDTYETIEDFLQDLMPSLEELMDKPFSFFGHSMGGMLAYLAVRELKSLQMPEPEALFISSMPHLSLYDKKSLDHRMSEADLVALFPHMSEEKIQDKELRTLLVKTLRSDLSLLSSYNYDESINLSIPLVAIRGEEDDRVSKNHMLAWQKEAMIQGFQFIERPGGHYYIYNDTVYVTALLNVRMSQLIQETVKVNS